VETRFRMQDLGVKKETRERSFEKRSPTKTPKRGKKRREHVPSKKIKEARQKKKKTSAEDRRIRKGTGSSGAYYDLQRNISLTKESQIENNGLKSKRGPAETRDRKKPNETKNNPKGNRH